MAFDAMNTKDAMRIMWALTLMMVMAWITEWLVNPTVTPLRTARIEGDFKYLKRAEIEQAVAGAVQGGFFTVDVESVKDAAESLPWVAKASVRRIWPDSVNISVVEQAPLARWSKASLINPVGEVFVPKSGMENMVGYPLLDGPKGSERTVIDMYRMAQKVLRPIEVKIARMELSKRHAWQLLLDSGLSVQLGVDQVRSRLRRFAQVYPALQRRWPGKIEKIDMRYAHGMAVKWVSDMVDMGSRS